MARFKILGPLEVTGDDGPIALGGPKQRALVALLLLHADETLSTDRIVDELWNGKPPKTATTSLWNLITQLRKVLPPDALVTKPGGYSLVIGDHELDYRSFEALVEEARRVEGRRRSELLQRALDLWRGPALSDLTFETFAAAEIDRLNELRLQTVEERIDVDLDEGLSAAVVPELERHVRENPLRERPRGQLMLALYRSGRQADSLQAYLAARRVLVDELGIEPSPALQRLYRSILRQESSLEHASPPSVADDHLANVIEAALAGRLVLVLGAGVDRADNGTAAGLPGPPEMIAELVEAFECPPDHSRELVRVAEYVALTKVSGRCTTRFTSSSTASTRLEPSTPDLPGSNGS
jgi:DNA-binding SARP family transcriptional activator